MYLTKHSFTRLLALVLIASAALTSLAQIPALQWEAETTTSKAKVYPLRQGATVRLEAQLTNYGDPLSLAAETPCILYWQTSDMAASQWWELPASVSTNGIATAPFTAHTPAPAKINFFFRVGGEGTYIYDALGQLNILPSPGMSPNALPLPVPTLDFDLVTVLNPPWASPADLVAATNSIVTVESDPVFGAWDKSTGISITHSQVSDMSEASVAWSDGANSANFATSAIQAQRATKATTADHATTAGTATNYDEEDPEFNAWLLTDPIQPKFDKKVNRSGDTLSGGLMNAPGGVGIYGVGIGTNFWLRAEFDGTNTSFNIYEVAR